MPSNTSTIRLVWLCVLFAASVGFTRSNPIFGESNSGEAEGSTSLSTESGGPNETSQTASNSNSMDGTTDDPTDDGTTGTMRRCGDGVKDPDLGEECDDGDEGNGPGRACHMNCTVNFCGDGDPSPMGQPCDDGPEGSDTCSPECMLRSCGDKILEYPEECEPELDPGACTPFCTLNVCGDGEVLDGESCEDGNLDDTDDCVECHTASCGDGATHVGFESCDDGNQEQGDNCLNDCTYATCGDGQVNEDGNEQCDGPNVPSCADLGADGGQASCDGCQVIGCTYCGNEVVEPGESCEPAGVPIGCGFFELNGEGNVFCTDDCFWDLAPCCVPAGDPCQLFADCCSGSCDNEVCAPR